MNNKQSTIFNETLLKIPCWDSMVVLKLYGHDYTHLNKTKKVTIQNGWMEENVIYECEHYCDSNYQQQKKTAKNILKFLKTTVIPIKNARDSKNCLVPLSLLCAFVNQAGGR